MQEDIYPISPCSRSSTAQSIMERVQWSCFSQINTMQINWRSSCCSGLSAAQPVHVLSASCLFGVFTEFHCILNIKASFHMFFFHQVCKLKNEGPPTLRMGALCGCSLRLLELIQASLESHIRDIKLAKGSRNSHYSART